MGHFRHTARRAPMILYLPFSKISPYYPRGFLYFALGRGLHDAYDDAAPARVGVPPLWYAYSRYSTCYYSSGFCHCLQHMLYYQFYLPRRLLSTPRLAMKSIKVFNNANLLLWWIDYYYYFERQLIIHIMFQCHLFLWWYWREHRIKGLECF